MPLHAPGKSIQIPPILSGKTEDSLSRLSFWGTEWNHPRYFNDVPLDTEFAQLVLGQLNARAMALLSTVLQKAASVAEDAATCRAEPLSERHAALMGTEALGAGWGCGLGSSCDMPPLPMGKRDPDYTDTCLPGTGLPRSHGVDVSHGDLDGGGHGGLCLPPRPGQRSEKTGPRESRAGRGRRGGVLQLFPQHTSPSPVWPLCHRHWLKFLQ